MDATHVTSEFARVRIAELAVQAAERRLRDAAQLRQLHGIADQHIGQMAQNELRGLTFRRSQRIEGFPDARHQAEVRSSIAFLVHGVLRSPHIV